MWYDEIIVCSKCNSLLKGCQKLQEEIKRNILTQTHYEKSRGNKNDIKILLSKAYKTYLNVNFEKWHHRNKLNLKLPDGFWIIQRICVTGFH